MVASCATRRDDTARFRESNEITEPQHLGGENPAPERGQAVIDAALIVVGVATLGRRLDQAGRLEATDMTIEGSRLQLDAPAALLEDVSPNPVPVSLAGRQHRHHGRLDGLEGQHRIDGRQLVSGSFGHGWYL